MRVGAPLSRYCWVKSIDDISYHIICRGRCKAAAKEIHMFKYFHTFARIPCWHKKTHSERVPCIVTNYIKYSLSLYIYTYIHARRNQRNGSESTHWSPQWHANRVAQIAHEMKKYNAKNNVRRAKLGGSDTFQAFWQRRISISFW